MVIDEVDQGKRQLGLGELGVSGSSWAYDGSQGVKLHKGPLPYASKTRWKTHDVVGCILDIDAGTISYTLNGTNLGVAFQAVHPEATEAIFPAFTLQGGPHWVRLGRRELKYQPDDCRLFGTSKKWNEQDGLDQGFGHRCLDYYCSCVELQQKSIFTFLLHWNRTTGGVKGPGQLIAQMVWEGREENLVKTFEQCGREELETEVNQ